MKRGITAGVMVGGGLLLAGCVQRRVVITSEPAGAVVTLNDVEIGRTPAEADFTYYGSYDVLVRHEGYEPLRTHKRAWAPVYEYPPLDIPASMIPTGVESTVKWHFVLEPAAERALSGEQLEAGLLERARGLRAGMTVAK